LRKILKGLAALAIASVAIAQQPAPEGEAKAPRVIPEDNRPPLFFRQEWKKMAKNEN
jgi:hypothetical protein